jgi:hypothetical protein
VACHARTTDLWTAPSTHKSLIKPYNPKNIGTAPLTGEIGGKA